MGSRIGTAAILRATLVGIGVAKGASLGGALLGLVAGVTEVVLPEPFRLSEEGSNKTTGTKVMTLGLYSIWRISRSRNTGES